MLFISDAAQAQLAAIPGDDMYERAQEWLDGLEANCHRTAFMQHPLRSFGPGVYAIVVDGVLDQDPVAIVWRQDGDDAHVLWIGNSDFDAGN